MTPKEKAKELVSRFLYIEGADDCGNSYPYVAEQCALICVDEILNARTVGDTGVIFDESYWKEVKQEINKL